MLECAHLYPIQKRYTAKHVYFSSLSDTLKHRTVDQMVESLDRNKIYFLQKDLNQIRKWFRFLFRDLKNSNCTPLIKFYNLFFERVTERYNWAKKILSQKNLKIKKDAIINLNPEKRSFFSSKYSLNQFHEKYIHYELASIDLTEKNMNRSKELLQDMYSRTYDRIASWNPDPTKDTLDHCLLEEGKQFLKKCKYGRWYARYLDNFARALDPHSGYLAQYQVDDFEITMNLSLEGVGASLSFKYGYTIVEKLLKGGAAKRSGKLKVKDKILAIGQSPRKMVNIFNWDLRDVVELIRGKKGTSVYLEVLRPTESGKNKQFVVQLTRSRIQLVENAAQIFYSKEKIYDHYVKVGVIKVPSFYGGSSSTGRSISTDVRELLEQAHKKGVEVIVLDLSGNGGGVLNEAVEVAGLFLEKGVIVRQGIKGYRGRTTYYDMGDDNPTIHFTGSLVVLIDRSSASASEIVAGALKDYGRAVIVGGDHTFGKGSIQSVEDISHGLGATKITVGLYFTPSGRSTQKTGVYSDIPLPSVISVDKFGEKELDYALPSQHTTSFFSLSFKRKWKKITKNVVQKLKIRSQKRVKKSEDFVKIKKDIEKYKKMTEEREKIKIKVLIAELEENDKTDKESEEEEDLDLNDPRFKKKYFSRADIKEAIKVALDLFSIQHSTPFFVKTESL